MITIRQRYRQQTDGQLASASLGKNEALQVRLRQKITVLRNARRRERRLQGTVSNLLQTLKDQKLLSDQANDELRVLEAYSDILLELFRLNKHIYESQKQLASILCSTTLLL